jgi:hypothetical protein
MSLVQSYDMQLTHRNRHAQRRKQGQGHGTCRLHSLITPLQLPSFGSTWSIATSTLDNHAMEPVLFAAVLMLFITKFTALTAVGVYFINS